MQAKSGQFQTGTGTGNISITGVGFQPAAVLFSSNGTSDTNWADHYVYSMGFAASAAMQGCAASSDRSGTATTSSERALRTSAYFLIDPLDGLADAEGALVSMDADGFTINRTTNDIDATIGYVALGGLSASVVNWSGGNLANPTITGAGFAPNAAITIGAGTANNAINSTLNFSLGIATESPGLALSNVSQNGVSGSNCYSRMTNSDHVLLMQSSNGVVSRRATLTAFTADGMTLNFSVTGSAQLYTTLFLAGSEVSSGIVEAPATNGVQSVTTGFQPKATVFGSHGFALDDATLIVDAQAFIGSRATENQANAVMSQSLQATTNCDRKRGITAAISLYDFERTSIGQGVVSHGNNGFSIDWTDLEGSQPRTAYLALGDEFVPLPTGVGGTQIRRRRLAGARR